MSFFWSLIVPWVLSMFLYRGRGFAYLVNWTALIFQGFVNFTIPALLYRSAIKRYPRGTDETRVFSAVVPAPGLEAAAAGRAGGFHVHVGLQDRSNIVGAEGTAREYVATELISEAQQEHISRYGSVSMRGERIAETRKVGSDFSRLRLDTSPSTGKMTDLPAAPVAAVPPWSPVRPGVAGAVVAGTMTLAVLISLLVDFYFLIAKGRDIVDG
jgi:hypothetical protein